MRGDKISPLDGTLLLDGLIANHSLRRCIEADLEASRVGGRTHRRAMTTKPSAVAVPAVAVHSLAALPHALAPTPLMPPCDGGAGALQAAPPASSGWEHPGRVAVSSGAAIWGAPSRGGAPQADPWAAGGAAVGVMGAGAIWSATWQPAGAAAAAGGWGGPPANAAHANLLAMAAPSMPTPALVTPQPPVALQHQLQQPPAAMLPPTLASYKAAATSPALRHPSQPVGQPVGQPGGHPAAGGIDGLLAAAAINPGQISFVKQLRLAGYDKAAAFDVMIRFEIPALGWTVQQLARALDYLRGSG